MKKQIKLLFKNGVISTRKLSVKDFEEYFFIFKYIFKNNMIGIQANDNPFWEPYNVHNRRALYRNLNRVKRFNNKDKIYIRIINRINYGDKYGIVIK